MKNRPLGGRMVIAVGCLRLKDQENVMLAFSSGRRYNIPWQGTQLR